MYYIDIHVAYFIVFRKPFQGHGKPGDLVAAPRITEEDVSDLMGELGELAIVDRVDDQLLARLGIPTAYLVMYKYFSSERDPCGVSSITPCQRWPLRDFAILTSCYTDAAPPS